MPIQWNKARSLGASTFVLVAVLTAHQVASVYHVYVDQLPTVSLDSSGFEYYARTYGSGGGRLGGMFYVNLLGLVYSLFGYSPLLGCEVSQVSFAIALVLFLECGKIIDIRATSLNWAILIFGLLPSCILVTAVTMREGFQMTGFLLVVYGLLRLRVRGVDLGIVLLPIGAIWLLLFHKGFAIFLLFALPLGILWATGSRLDRFLVALAGAFVVLFLFGDTMWDLMLEKSTSLRRIVEGEGLAYIDLYADQVEEGRTEFDVNLKLDSVGGFFSTGPIVFTYYLFSPLPWQIRAALDIEGLAESLVRMLLLFWALLFYVRSTGEERKVQGFFLLMFLFMEMTWAAGTANWGTAIRHRLVAWPLLVLLGMRGGERLIAESVEAKRPLSKRQRIRELRRKSREQLSTKAPES